MNTYLIENTMSGVVLGYYDGATQEEALDAMARDAGYADYAAAEAVAPSGDDNWLPHGCPPLNRDGTVPAEHRRMHHHLVKLGWLGPMVKDSEGAPCAEITYPRDMPVTGDANARADYDVCA